MQKLLITGASGFVGSRIMKALQKDYELLTPSHTLFDITSGESISISMCKAIEASGGAIRFSDTIEGLKAYEKSLS